MEIKIFSQRLKDLRNEKNLQQAEVANAAGISKSSYNYYETGKRQPTITAISKLADFYEVTTDYLIGRTNHPDGLIITNVPEELKSIGVNYLTISANELIKILPKEIYDEIIKQSKERYKGE